MRFVVVPLEMRHTVQASKGCALTLESMAVELLLREDVSATLVDEHAHVS